MPAMIIGTTIAAASNSVAGTKVAGRHYLKFTLLNAEATLEDIGEIIALLRRSGERLLAADLPAAGPGAKTEARA